jgi:MFS transporter, AAHS family, 4-hydroxybenzoate transporter
MRSASARLAGVSRSGAEASPSGSARAVIVCLLISMVDGYDTILPSFTGPLLRSSFALSLRELGNFLAIGYVGALLGSVLGGQLADRFGRRLVMVIFLMICGIATAACAAAPSFGALMVVRFVAGVGLGGALPSLFALTAEHAPSRGSVNVVLMYLGYPIGGVVGGLITALVLRFGWRSIFLGSAASALIMVPLALLIPESLRTGQGAPAQRRGLAVTVARISAQFAEGRLGAALLLWVGLFCMLLMTYLLVSWIPTIAVGSGIALRAATLSAVVLSLGGILGALLLTPLIKRYGPFLPPAIMIAGACAFIAELGRCFGSASLLMTMLTLIGLTALGGQLAIPAMGVQLFPARVRGTGSGWLMAVGRLGSIAGPLVGGSLLSRGLSLGTLFPLIACAAAIAAVALASAGLIAPRTSQHD